MAHGDDLPAGKMPLVEAVFEFKWKLTASSAEVRPPTDPHYKLLVGSFFDKVKGDYPFHETLPAAGVPDEFVPQIVQHRFRTAENAYPLIQIGPGVLAANETSGYSWKTYQPRIVDAVTKLRDTYAGDLASETVVLRYINGIPFEFATEDVFAFMRENFKVTVGYPHQLFSEQPAEQRPNTVLVESSHQLKSPPGVIGLKFTTGEYNGRQHLLWETNVVATGEDAPSLEGLAVWLNQAHDVSRAWFFTLIEGQLEEGFRS